MFQCDIGLIKNALEGELGDETEFFYDIHCSDPFEENREYVFPVAAAHDAGLYLVLFANGSEGHSQRGMERLDYVCKVFRSYFATKVPIRSLFVLCGTKNGQRRCKADKELVIYDCHNKVIHAEDICYEDDLRTHVENHVRNDVRHRNLKEVS